MLKITDLGNFQAAVQRYLLSPNGLNEFSDVIALAHTNSNYSPEINEKNLLNFLRFARLGLTLLKGDINTFGSWQKLSLGENNNVVPTPCN
jgi:hypothetical protein